jgi:hypothetical protein
MLRTSLGSIVCGLVLGAAAAGCGVAPVTTGASGMLALADVLVDYTGVGGVHHYGSTDCPQQVGSLVIHNTATVDMMLVVGETSSQLDLFEVGETGSETPWEPRTIGPDEVIEIVIRFNCSSTTDIATSITLGAGPLTGSEYTDTLPIALDVQGAP